MGGFKVKEIGSGGSGFSRFRLVTYGDSSLGRVLLAELIQFFTGWMPGAPGLLLRKLLYPFLFAATGRGVVFGRNLTLRHPHKIRLGDRVIVDENVVLDAKGEANRGIDIGADVYVGRNTIIYCKGGDILLGDRVSVSSNCQLFSSNRLVVREDTVVGAFSYLLSGGEYDPADPRPFALQPATHSRGETVIGPDAWIAAHVTVLDGSVVGERAVVGAGAVVRDAIPGRTVAVGAPARVVRRLDDPRDGHPS